jgi:hypothetical protein
MSPGFAAKAAGQWPAVTPKSMGVAAPVMGAARRLTQVMDQPCHLVGANETRGRALRIVVQKVSLVSNDGMFVMTARPSVV